MDYKTEVSDKKVAALGEHPPRQADQGIHGAIIHTKETSGARPMTNMWPFFRADEKSCSPPQSGCRSFHAVVTTGGAAGLAPQLKGEKTRLTGEVREKCRIRRINRMDISKLSGSKAGRNGTANTEEVRKTYGGEKKSNGYIKAERRSR